MSSAADVDFARVVEGVELIAQDVYWRLSTPQGQGIFAEDAPEYGLDLAGMVGQSLSPSEEAAMPGRIRSELLRDERILTVHVDISSALDTWAIAVSCTTADGPFQLEFRIDAAGIMQAETNLLRDYAIVQ